MIFTIITTLIYECCFGLKQKQQEKKKSVCDFIVDLEEIAEEELEKILSHYDHKRKKKKLACC